MKTVEIEIREVYGQIKIYPSNSEARALCAIANTKTLSMSILEQCPSLGLRVTVIDGGAIIARHAARNDRHAKYILEALGC